MLKVKNNPNTITGTSIRLNEETKKGINKLAKRENRSTSFLINEAIKNYISLREWQIKEIEESLEECNNGQFVDEKEISMIFDKHRA